MKFPKLPNKINVSMGYDPGSPEGSYTVVTVAVTREDVRNGYVEYEGRRFTFSDPTNPPYHVNFPIYPPPQPQITGKKADLLILDDISDVDVDKAAGLLTDSLREKLTKQVTGRLTGDPTKLLKMFASGGKVGPPVNVEVLKSLTAKLQRSEKQILRDKGEHPRKNRTYTLLNYMDMLTDEEIELLLGFVNQDRRGKAEIHAGMVSFLKKDYALEVIYNNTKKSPSPDVNVQSISFISKPEREKLRDTINTMKMTKMKGTIVPRRRGHR